VRAARGSNASEALWRNAVAEYEAAHAQFDRNWTAYETAEREAQDTEAFREREELANAYGLRQYMTRDEALECVDRAITAREAAKRPAGHDWTDEEADAQADESLGIVQRYFALVREVEGDFEGLRVKALHAEHRRFCVEVFEPAREKLLATPAPDCAAALRKAEVLATMHDEAEGLRDDLRRLARREAK
jgi:hypothetical protein